MGDIHGNTPNHQCLFGIATGQHGYFTSKQAGECGFSTSLLSHQVKSGKYHRIRRGLYRLRDYPSSPVEGVVRAWLAVGKYTAVVSHESALELLELSNAIPHAVHLTVPRSKRHLPNLTGVKIHTTMRTLGPRDVTTREGIMVTSPTRSILDAAEAGTAPEQIELAIRQALRRGLVTKSMLSEGARNRNQRVRQLVEGAFI